MPQIHAWFKIISWEKIVIPEHMVDEIKSKLETGELRTAFEVQDFMLTRGAREDIMCDNDFDETMPVGYVQDGNVIELTSDTGETLFSL